MDSNSFLTVSGKTRDIQADSREFSIVEINDVFNYKRTSGFFQLHKDACTARLPASTSTVTIIIILIIKCAFEFSSCGNQK